MKIFVIGSGRSGSTFLIKLLTRLGFDTKLTPYQEEHYHPEWRAGCEFSFTWDKNKSVKELKKEIESNLPYVMKAPMFSFQLKDIVKEGIIDIEHLIIPVRDIDEATKSRIDVGLEWNNCGKDYGSQKAMGLAALGASIELGMMCDIPYTLMKFPDFIKDKKLCYQQLKRIFPSIKKEKFNKEFDKLANVKQIKYG